jgi:peptidoglycan/xylan/chitin deacetylase (PgdA/CDA1 family)
MRGSPARLALPAALLAACAAPRPAATRAAPPPSKQVAVTVDDLILPGPPASLRETLPVDDALTAKLRAARVPAIGFVNEQSLYAPGEVDARIAALRLWVERGYDLGNHTFSHLRLATTTAADYEADVIRGETVTSRLLAERGKRLEYFRYPYLSTGATPEVRSEIEGFLRSRGYADAPVTVDAHDWLFAAAYARAKARRDRRAMAMVVAADLAHTRAMIAFAEATARAAVGRPIRQILLIHCNALNAEHLDELLDVFRREGYAFVPLREALEDPAYARPDGYVGPGGPTWTLRWLAAEGRPSPVAAPRPPQAVEDLAKDAPGGP